MIVRPRLAVRLNVPLTPSRFHVRITAESARRTMKPEPPTDAEFDRLDSVLARFGDKHSMNLEKLDGFLAALICGPATVLPSEYFPVIWSNDIVLENTLKAQPLLHDFLALIMRHWNVIADTLHSGDIYLPLLLEDGNGLFHANDWAAGFLRGMELRKRHGIVPMPVEIVEAGAEE